MRVKLSDITQYSKGVQINGDELVDNGDYIYLNGGINPSGRWTESNVGANTVTISEGGNSSGYINYITEPFWCGAHCYYLFNGPKNTKYLYYALKSQQDRLFAIRSGACMPNIKKSDLGKFEFEFDTNEQKQNEIVATLSRVENVIACRKRELELLDDLIKARFVEMFGDPVLNPFGWKMKRFDEICENLDSRRKPISAGDRIEGIYPYYGASGIVDYVEDYIFDEDILLVSEDGANLLMRSTPIAFSVSGKVWVNNHAHVVRFDKRSLQKYVEIYFSLIDISDSITGSAQPKLNQAKLNAMMIPIPEDTLLDKYYEFLHQIDKSKLAFLFTTLLFLQIIRKRCCVDYRYMKKID